MKKERLKELQQERAQLVTQCNTFTEQITELSKQRSEVQKQLTRCDNLIKQIVTPKEITVSDHAVLRLLERGDNINVEQIRERLIPQSLRDQVDVLGGTGLFPVENGQVRMENYKVVTYIED